MIDVYVKGLPIPKGSWRAPAPGVFKASDPRMKAWIETVQWICKFSMRGKEIIKGAAVARLLFILPRLQHSPPTDKSPLGRVRTYSAEDHPAPDIKPDIDKLDRAILDGLTKIVIADDCRIVSLRSDKIFSDQDPDHREVGARIRVAPMMPEYWRTP